jgi:hypothetical protein
MGVTACEGVRDEFGFAWRSRNVANASAPCDLEKTEANLIDCAIGFRTPLSER